MFPRVCHPKVYIQDKFLRMTPLHISRTRRRLAIKWLRRLPKFQDNGECIWFFWRNPSWSSWGLKLIQPWYQINPWIWVSQDQLHQTCSPLFHLDPRLQHASDISWQRNNIQKYNHNIRQRNISSASLVWHFRMLPVLFIYLPLIWTTQKPSRCCHLPN